MLINVTLMIDCGDVGLDGEVHVPDPAFLVVCDYKVFTDHVQLLQGIRMLRVGDIANVLHSIESLRQPLEGTAVAFSSTN